MTRNFYAMIYLLWFRIQWNRKIIFFLNLIVVEINRLWKQIFNLKSNSWFLSRFSISCKGRYNVCSLLIIDLSHRNLRYLHPVKEKRASRRAFFICRHIPVIFFNTSLIDAITSARSGLMCSTSRISLSIFGADEMKVELMRLYLDRVCQR